VQRRILVWGAAMLAATAVTATASAGARTSSGSGFTLTLLANTAPAGSPDPQVNYTAQEWFLLIDTHDGLVTFAKAGGKAGTAIVADLATTVPKPTDGGKTYTFTLRSGIKFSNGKPVTASDVKATFVRLFKIKDSPNAGAWYNVIEGGDACVKTPASCNLDKGITISGNKVTFHLSSPDPEFLDQLAVPFAFILPASTPAHNLNIPPAGTGPYMWKQYSPNKQIELVRNPYFKVWNAAAQPAGIPDTIVEKFGLSVEAEVTAVENGQADYVFDPIPSDRLNELGTKYVKQVYVSPLTADYYFSFNTRVPPFDNLDARKAVNYATDRNALVKVYGGPRVAQPTCQILPPNFPGYQPYCPYTKNPGATWSAPDMAKATALMKASHTAGMAVKVNTTNDPVGKGVGLYFVSLLNKLGYKATLQPMAQSIQYPFIQNSKNKVQFAYSQWFQDYPAASDFLNILLGCGSYHPNSDSSPNISEYCNKSIQAQMDKARVVGETSPSDANVIWAKVDHLVTDQAPWVDMFNPKQIDFLSARLGNHVFSPEWQFLYDQVKQK
jgi:peptide/nickel transport system substrate-binding protein